MMNDNMSQFLIGRKLSGKPSDFHKFFFGNKLRIDNDKDGIPFGMDCNDNNFFLDAPIIPPQLQALRPTIAKTLAPISTQTQQVDTTLQDRYNEAKAKLESATFEDYSQKYSQISDDLKQYFTSPSELMQSSEYQQYQQQKAAYEAQQAAASEYQTALDVYSGRITTPAGFNEQSEAAKAASRYARLNPSFNISEEARNLQKAGLGGIALKEAPAMISLGSGGTGITKVSSSNTQQNLLEMQQTFSKMTPTEQLENLRNRFVGYDTRGNPVISENINTVSGYKNPIWFPEDKLGSVITKTGVKEVVEEFSSGANQIFSLGGVLERKPTQESVGYFVPIGTNQKGTLETKQLSPSELTPEQLYKRKENEAVFKYSQSAERLNKEINEKYQSAILSGEMTYEEAVLNSEIEYNDKLRELNKEYEEDITGASVELDLGIMKASRPSVVTESIIAGFITGLAPPLGYTLMGVQGANMLFNYKENIRSIKKNPKESLIQFGLGVTGFAIGAKGGGVVKRGISNKFSLISELESTKYEKPKITKTPLSTTFPEEIIFYPEKASPENELYNSIWKKKQEVKNKIEFEKFRKENPPLFQERKPIEFSIVKEKPNLKVSESKPLFEFTIVKEELKPKVSDGFEIKKIKPSRKTIKTISQILPEQESSNINKGVKQESQLLYKQETKQIEVPKSALKKRINLVQQTSPLSTLWGLQSELQSPFNLMSLSEKQASRQKEKQLQFQREKQKQASSFLIPELQMGKQQVKQKEKQLYGFLDIQREKQLQQESYAKRLLFFQTYKQPQLETQKEKQKIGLLQRPLLRQREIQLEKYKQKKEFGYGFINEEKSKQEKETGYNAYVRIDATKKIKAHWEKLNKKPMKENSALGIMAEFVDKNISARGKIVPVKLKQKEELSKQKNTYFDSNSYKFREYKIRKGTKQKTPLTFIERESYRVDSPGEIKGLKSRKEKARIKTFFGM
jgi:hypothetical protein